MQSAGDKSLSLEEYIEIQGADKNKNAGVYISFVRLYRMGSSREKAEKIIK